MSNESEKQVLGERYELERVLRSDLLGKTWRALDLTTATKVDIRMLPAWADVAAARGDLNAVQSIKHAAIVETIDLVNTGDLAGYVLAANDGETMAQRRARRPRRHFEISEVKPWLRSIVDALGAMHGQGRAHGALHLGSVLIEGSELQLTDVAVASMLLPQADAAGRPALSAAMLSPQLLEFKAPTAADDVYALGAMLYDLLTGQPLFSSGDIHSQVMGTKPASIQQRREQLEITSMPLPQPWEDWIAAALAKQPQQRPALGDLAELLKSGAYAARAAQREGAAAATTSRSTVAPALAGAMASFSKNQMLLGAAALVVLIALSSVYLFKIKPQQEFKASITAAYQEVLSYDAVSPALHEEVIQRWQTFETTWQKPIQAEYPDLLPVLTDAAQKRSLREQQKELEAERLRQEQERKRKAYIASARAALDVTQIKISAPTTTREERIAEWKGFIAKFDVDYEGARLPEVTPMIAEAVEAKTAIEKAIAAEQKEKADYLALREKELAELNVAEANAALPVAEKIRRVEAFLATCASAPASVQKEAVFLSMKSSVAAKMEPLRSAAALETPAEPLKLDVLFAGSSVAAYSPVGRLRVLKRVQEKLKEGGYLEAEPSTEMTKNVHLAIIAFQNAQKLVPSAAIDAATLAALQLGELTDDATPLPIVATSKPKSSGSYKPKAKEPEKSGVAKGADAVKKGLGNAFKAVGGFLNKK